MKEILDDPSLLHRPGDVVGYLTGNSSTSTNTDLVIGYVILAAGVLLIVYAPIMLVCMYLSGLAMLVVSITSKYRFNGVLFAAGVLCFFVSRVLSLIDTFP
jgi:hypothetical protein